MTTKIINDLGFMLLGLLLAFGLYTEQFQNQWVLMLSTNALVAFILIHYKPQNNFLQKKQSNENKEMLTQSPSAPEGLSLSNLFEPPPVPNLNDSPQCDEKLKEIKTRYNINNNVDYNKDDEDPEPVNNVIPMRKIMMDQNKIQKEEMNQQGIDQFIKESQKVVSLADYREKKFKSGFNPIQGA